MAGTRALSSKRILVALCVFVVVLGAWNVLRYPPGLGYDAVDHTAYANGLVFGGHLPHSTGEYYTPPGWYALAGTADWVAKSIGIGEPRRAGMGLNILFLLGTVLLTWRIAQELFPGRDRLALGAAAFVAFLPVSVKTEAMFHPEPLSVFLCTLALWLVVRTFADRRYALGLGVVLGAAQLVRAFTLWTVAAAVIALIAGRRWRELAIVVVLAAVIPAPWYIHQRQTYGGDPVFPQPVTKEGRSATGSTKFLLERRPVSFYVDPGLPPLLTSPWRPHFLNRALPTTYSELWGDYFGFWVWKGEVKPAPHAQRQLQLQSVVGLLPTLLAIVGFFAFLRGSLRSPPRLAIAVLPVLGLLGYLYFTVGYPTPDGDTIKASFMLTTTVGWALGFGYALDRLRGRAWKVTGVLLALCALAEVPFLFYG